MPSPLTDLKIRKTKPQTWLSDPQHRGLRLYKGDGGIGTWWYRYRSITRTDSKGRPILDTVKLGVYPKMELGDARQQWRILKNLRGTGSDPKTYNARKAPYTCTELADGYINGYARKLKKSWRNDARVLEKDVIPRIGDQPATLSRNDAKELLAEVAQRGDEAATQLLAICRKAWSHAIEEEKVTVNPFERLKIINGVVLASDVKARKNKKQRTYWDDLALQKFLRWLPESSLHLQAQRIAQLQLLTAARPGEVCGMSWDEVDFERGEWTVPPERHKAGKAHKVMLSDQAKSILLAQKKTSEYVFPSIQDDRRPCKHNWHHHQWKRHVESAHLDYITPHALRHSAITGLAILRCPQEITTRIAGHASVGITENVYQHHERDAEAREWLQRWADHLDALQVDNVTALVR